MGYVYKITNNVNNRIYVGITTESIQERWKKHKSASRYEDTYIYRAMRKYGIDNFSIEMIEETNDLSEREQYWISKLNTLKPNGYNLTIGGEKLYGENNPFYGKKHTLETKMKLSRISKLRIKDKNHFYGKHHTDETKSIISLKNSGKIHSKEYKEYMKEINTGENNPFYGKSHTDETKKKISQKNMYKNIIMLDSNKKYIKTFETMSDIHEYLIQNNLCKSTIKYENVVKYISISNRDDILKYKHYWIIQQKGVTTTENTSYDGS
jgi:group I intron endonuclease